MRRILIGVSIALLSSGALAQTVVIPGGDLGTSAGASAEACVERDLRRGRGRSRLTRGQAAVDRYVSARDEGGGLG